MGVAPRKPDELELSSYHFLQLHLYCNKIDLAGELSLYYSQYVSFSSCVLCDI